MDLTAGGTTDILVSYSDDQGLSWTAPLPVTDRLFSPVDRFNHWLSADPVTGDPIVNAAH
jgi:Neuraminidase (sialidase)